jgi:biopolymer transport protein ExbD
MTSRFQQAKQRRAERAPITAHGSINLVPLVDVLTSIVFFSLLTYQGNAMAALTSFDLTLPPVVINTPEQAQSVKREEDVLNLLLAVRVDNGGMLVEHSGGGGFHQRIDGLDDAALDRLQALMTDIRTQYPQNSDVLVIPADDVNYDTIVRVLERLRIARFAGIALGTRERAASAAPRGGR